MSMHYFIDDFIPNPWLAKTHDLVSFKLRHTQCHSTFVYFWHSGYYLAFIPSSWVSTMPRHVTTLKEKVFSKTHCPYIMFSVDLSTFLVEKKLWVSWPLTTSTSLSHRWAKETEWICVWGWGGESGRGFVKKFLKWGQVGQHQSDKDKKCHSNVGQWGKVDCRTKRKSLHFQPKNLTSFDTLSLFLHVSPIVSKHIHITWGH